MKSFVAALTAVVLLAVGASAQSLTINTPADTAVVQCRPIQLSWGGGVPPYFLSVTPGNQPAAAALQDLGPQSGTTFTWNTNLAAGTSIGFQIRDSAGIINNSAAVTIQPSSDTSCLGQSQSGVTGTTAGNTSATGGGTTNTTPAGGASTTTPAGGASATTPASGGSKTTSATSGAPSKTNGASAHAAQIGAAGFVGAALAAILA